jgi:hypothetical protein
MINFYCQLSERVSLVLSKETGIVIARAQYLNSENSYLVRYKCSDGRLVEQWWGESALVSTADLED